MNSQKKSLMRTLLLIGMGLMIPAICLRSAIRRFLRGNCTTGIGLRWSS